MRLWLAIRWHIRSWHVLRERMPASRTTHGWSIDGLLHTAHTHAITLGVKLSAIGVHPIWMSSVHIRLLLLITTWMIAIRHTWVCVLCLLLMNGGRGDIWTASLTHWRVRERSLRLERGRHRTASRGLMWKRSEGLRRVIKITASATAVLLIRGTVGIVVTRCVAVCGVRRVAMAVLWNRHRVRLIRIRLTATAK